MHVERKKNLRNPHERGTTMARFIVARGVVFECFENRWLCWETYGLAFPIIFNPKLRFRHDVALPGWRVVRVARARVLRPKGGTFIGAMDDDTLAAVDAAWRREASDTFMEYKWRTPLGDRSVATI